MDDNALVRYSLDDGLAAIVLDRLQASNALNLARSVFITSTDHAAAVEAFLAERRPTFVRH